MRSLADLIRLDGRVAIITGGAGHLGRAFGAALAELGASIAIVDVDARGASTAAEQLRAVHRVPCEVFPIDLTRDDDVRGLPGAVVDRLGRIDILVNNAALVGTSELPGWAVPFDDQDVNTWRLALEVNLTAPFLLTQACAGALRSSGHGAVINIGSIYGMSGALMRLYEGTRLGNPAAYAASKGGLLQLSRWLATVLAPAVRVNTITVGGIWRQQPEPFVHRYVEHTPLGRMAVEEDLKGAVAYLATDLSAFVTGHNLVVDGGWTAW